MSKNLTRKGLAFGALVALATSAFAGTPALAADALVLAANYSSDTTLATASTETFTLNASLAPGSVAANISQLKYKIVNNGALTVHAAANVSGTADVTASAGYGYLTPGSPSSTVANTVDLSLTSAATTSTTQTVTVTAFLDSNSNGTLDSGETSAAQTVSFIKYSEITTSTTVTAPIADDTTATAVVKFTNINNQSLTSSKVGAVFTKGDGTSLSPVAPTVSGASFTASNVATITATGHGLVVGEAVTISGFSAASGGSFDGTYVVATVPTADTFTIATTGKSGTITRTSATVTPTNVYTGVTYSATAGGFKYVTSAQAAFAKGAAVKVQPLLSSSALSAASGNSVGTAVSNNVVAHVVGSLNGNTVKSTTASAASSAGTSVTQNVSLNGTKQVYFIAKDTASTPAAYAGATVNVAVTVTGASLSATTPVTVTVNGTTYSSAAALPGATGVAKLALTTGADGKAVITYSTSGFANGNTVVFTATTENYTASVTGTETTRTYAGSTTYIANNEGDTAATTDGAPVALNVVVQDQFGAAPADGTFTVTATWDATLGSYVAQATAASTSASSTFANVVGGKATLSITDNGTGLGVNQYIIELRPVSANGVLGSATKTIASAFTINIVSAADAAAGAVALTGSTTKSATTGVWTINASSTGASDTPKALTYSAFAAADLRGVVASAPSNVALDGSTAVTGLAIAGTVKSASTSTYAGVVVPSASVTIAGAGLEFAATQDGVLVYGTDSLTINAAADGTFSFSVWSHKAGANTVTIKSGTDTQTASVYFAAAAELSASAVTVTVADGASQFQAGRALDVAFKVTDKFGNPVALDTTYAGSTDAKLVIAQTGAGYLSLSGVQATSTAGTFTSKLITNSGDLGTSTITATVDFYDTTLTDLVSTKSSEFGVTDVDVTTGGRAIYASAEFAKGKTVTVSIDGNRLYSKLQSSDNYVELKFTQKKAGKHVVTIKVSGGLSYTETATTTK